MAERLGFKECYRPVMVPSEGVFLLSERGHFLLRGTAYLHLAPLLCEGAYSGEEIIELLDGTLAPAEAYYALDLLRSKGYIADRAATVRAERAAWWSLLDVDPAVAEDRLAAARVTIRPVGPVDAASLGMIVAHLGLNCAEDGDFRIILADDYLNPALDAINRDALATGMPWLLAGQVGIEPWIGPIFVPGRTGCWECLAHRLRGHRRIERYVQEKTGTTDPCTSAPASLPSTLHTAAALIATEVARWFACDGAGSLEGRSSRRTFSPTSYGSIH